MKEKKYSPKIILQKLQEYYREKKSITDFCNKNNINYYTFIDWHKLYDKESAKQGKLVKKDSFIPKDKKLKSLFTKITIPQKDNIISEAACSFDLASGKIQIYNSISKSTLEHLIKAIKN